jgi:hypothetical protein
LLSEKADPESTDYAILPTYLMFKSAGSLLFNHYHKEFKAFEEELDDQDQYWETQAALGSFLKLGQDAE